MHQLLPSFLQVVPILVHLVAAISSVRLYIPKDLRPVDNRQSVLKSIKVSSTGLCKLSALISKVLSDPREIVPKKFV